MIKCCGRKTLNRYFHQIKTDKKLTAGFFFFSFTDMSSFTHCAFDDFCDIPHNVVILENQDQTLSCLLSCFSTFYHVHLSLNVKLNGLSLYLLQFSLSFDFFLKYSTKTSKKNETAKHLFTRH